MRIHQHDFPSGRGSTTAIIHVLKIDLRPEYRSSINAEQNRGTERVAAKLQNTDPNRAATAGRYATIASSLVHMISISAYTGTSTSTTRKILRPVHLLSPGIPLAHHCLFRIRYHVRHLINTQPRVRTAWFRHAARDITDIPSIILSSLHPLLRDSLSVALK